MKINGEMHFLWRAVDQEGEILESYLTKARHKKAALQFMQKALKRHGSSARLRTQNSFRSPARDVVNRCLKTNPRFVHRCQRGSTQLPAPAAGQASSCFHRRLRRRSLLLPLAGRRARTRYAR